MIHDPGSFTFEIGRDEVLRGGADVALIGNGLPCPERIGVNDEFGHCGPAGELLKQFGLCGGHIAQMTAKLFHKPD